MSTSKTLGNIATGAIAVVTGLGVANYMAGREKAIGDQALKLEQGANRERELESQRANAVGEMERLQDEVGRLKAGTKANAETIANLNVIISLLQTEVASLESRLKAIKAPASNNSAQPATSAPVPSNNNTLDAVPATSTPAVSASTPSTVTITPAWGQPTAPAAATTTTLPATTQPSAQTMSAPTLVTGTVAVAPAAAAGSEAIDPNKALLAERENIGDLIAQLDSDKPQEAVEIQRLEARRTQIVETLNSQLPKEVYGVDRIGKAFDHTPDGNLVERAADHTWEITKGSARALGDLFSWPFRAIGRQLKDDKKPTAEATESPSK